MDKESENNAQGHKETNTSGTNTFFFLDHDVIKNIPVDRKITYFYIAVDYRLQEPKPNRGRVTSGRNFIEYPYDVKVKSCLCQNIIEQCCKL